MASVAKSTTENPKRRGHKRGDGEGSISQRPDGLWRGRVMVGRRLDGKPNVRDVYARTRGECQRKLDELRRSAASGTLVDPAAGRESVAAFLARWLEAIEGTIRPSTLARYRVNVNNHLIPALGHHKLTALKPEHLVALYAQKRKNGLAPRTVKYLHTTIKLALAMALKWGAIPRNVATVVDPPKVPRSEITPPTPEQVGHLLDTADARGDRFAPLWTVAVYSGFREGELLGMKWDDVDFAAGTISARRTLLGAAKCVPQFGEPKTARSRRTITLAEDAIAALRRQRARQAEDKLAATYYADYGLVFATESGTPLLARNVVRSFKLALERAELPKTIRVHDLRHSAATLMLAAGVHPKTASERLGHTSVTITMDLYTHAVKGLDADAATRMQDAVRMARKAVAGAG